MSALISKTETYVKQHMSHYDASHDYAHIERVLRLARHIARTESASDFPSHSGSHAEYDLNVVTLAALLHDVGDRKYLPLGHDGTRLARDFLLSADAPLDLAERVQEVVNAVSYSRENKDPTGVAAVLARLPELGPVQDADRLDAIGAVGIGRCFTFGGAKGDRGMDDAITHVEEKLERLESMMKTNTGREMARVRTERLVLFREWWKDELGTEDHGSRNE